MTTTLIFDLDGTLLNTLADLRDCVNYALRCCHYPQRTTEEVRRALGNGVRALMLDSVPEDVEGEAFEHAFALFKAHYVRHSMDTTAPYEGIMPLLAELQRREYCMAIVSNKMQQAVSDLHAHFFARHLHVAIGESEHVRRKPAPDTVIEALRQLGSKREDAVYVGDSEVDLATARNAGLRCLSVTWGFRDEAFLRKEGAQYLMHRPEDILSYLEQEKAL